jgi:hypothetical protein
VAARRTTPTILAHVPSGTLSSVTAELPVCSAKGCRQPATWALRWNNPKIHTPERRKTWLACPDHLTSLSQFLGARGFLKETEAL